MVLFTDPTGRACLVSNCAISGKGEGMTTPPTSNMTVFSGVLVFSKRSVVDIRRISVNTAVAGVILLFKKPVSRLY